jgi:Immunoglobulin-like domain of bacterial spore germination/Sporulation and spore germination
MRRLTAGLAGLGMLCALAACAGRGATGTGPDPGAAAASAATGTTAAGATRAAGVKQHDAHLNGRQLHLAVYYLRTWRGRRYLAPEWHPVPRTRAVAAAALGELLGGQPLFPGARRPFPPGARLRGVSVEAGTATVDLSGSALPGGTAGRWRLQALVHTLTQFPTVRRVKVEREGRAVAGPLTRDPDLPLAPIALAHPSPGVQVRGGRLVVKGEASVFEGTVGLRLRDDRGKVMAQSYATAARGAPGRGPFSGALRFTPPATSRAWTLDAFEVSPEDGEITYAVTVPVWVGR